MLSKFPMTQLVAPVKIADGDRMVRRCAPERLRRLFLADQNETSLSRLEAETSYAHACAAAGNWRHPVIECVA
jgi:hypothetical protein